MAQRILYIRNGIQIPIDVTPKVFSGKKLTVLYAGRGTPEKRVHLVARIALLCKLEKLPIDFTFLGDVRPYLDNSLAEAGNFVGNISDQEKVESIYRQSDILIITSSEEGFPMVVMEAMARGCIILATPVGDLPAHIHQSRQGFLFSTVTDEEKITSVPKYIFLK